MAMTQEEKEAILDQHLICSRKADHLEITLIFQGKTDEAEQVGDKNKLLRDEIDALLGSLMDEWLGQAELVGHDLRLANTNLQRRIKDIKDKINVAENVVKALGYIDDVIRIAKKLVAAA
jgi:hypothetical protein